MTTNKISIAGYFAGTIIVLGSIWRYAIVFEDMGRLFQWSILGLLLLGWSINYDNSRKMNARMTNFVDEIIK